jgi:hypothetical protein
MNHFKHTFCCFLFILSAICNAQSNNDTVLIFDFNEHQFKEKNNRIVIKPVGVTLTEDRFGNKQSAVYLHGNTASYINLGTSDLLKIKKGTVSMWTNVQGTVHAGKGYKGNPLLVARNSASENFHIALGIGVSVPNNRFGAQSSKDSVQEAIAFARDTLIPGQWYHLAVTIDNNQFALYVDGELQQRISKRFETHYLEEDSILVGRSLGYKNERYANAIVDDIRFYHRVLNEKEIIDLYNDPNPNWLKNLLSEILKYGVIILIGVLIIVIILIRNRRNLKKQKEYYELNNRIKELEIKVIKTQMNPHFISNALAAIQNLILKNEVGKAGQYLSKFSFFMRQVLEYSEKTYINLEEELEIIKTNVELEQLRFKNNFTFTVKVDENIKLSEVLIPSLITQPFIENAIWHGLLPLTARDPKLFVRIYLKNEVVFVEIVDNGVGRSIKESPKKKNSKGTKLVIDKIENINKLRNSVDFKLKIIDLYDENKKPEGTRIVIELNNYTQ